MIDAIDRPKFATPDARRAVERRAVAALARPEEPNLPLDQEGLRQWRKADRIHAQAMEAKRRRDKVGAEKLFVQAGDIRIAIIKRLEGAKDNASVCATLRSAAERLESAGQPFTTHHDGYIAIDTQQGLKVAFEARHLEGGKEQSFSPQDLRNTGELYWAAYERVEGNSSPPGGTGASGRREGPQHSLLDAGDVLRVMRTMQTAIGLIVLDEICGKGFTINAVATAKGMGHLTVKKALRRALETAAENWKGAKDREPDTEFAPPTREQLALKTQRIVAARRSC